MCHVVVLLIGLWHMDVHHKSVRCRDLGTVELACGVNAQAVANGACMSPTVLEMSHPLCFNAAASFLGMSTEISDSVVEKLAYIHGNCTQSSTMVCINSHRNPLPLCHTCLDTCNRTSSAWKRVRMPACLWNCHK